MEQKIATWTVAAFVAVFVALIIYGCTIDLFEAETIRTTAETGIVVVALGITTTLFRT